jgi:histidyl-tRNA synthetase
MIKEHEIPKGSKLYFGSSAKAKRDFEARVSSLLESRGFEEIVTPNFSYSQHQSIENAQELIRLSDSSNCELSLRADSTLDVVRIITKRLGRTTSNKKWFYVQPVFSYPSNEYYQIGCEWIEHDRIEDIINLSIDILHQSDTEHTVQLANINIPKLIAQEMGIDISLFKDGDMSALNALKIEWLDELMRVDSIDKLESISVPGFLKDEVSFLISVAKKIDSDFVVLSPLYISSLKYYDGIYYRILDTHKVLAKGGKYCSGDLNSLGFALYLDNII